MSTEEEKINQREQAMYIAHRYKSLGHSQQELLDMVELCSLDSKKENEIMLALKDRGELEHLITWIWTW